MCEEKGVGLADAERIVELNLGYITEKLLQTSSAGSSCTTTSGHSTHAVDEPASSFYNTHSNFRAEVLRSHKDHDPHHSAPAKSMEDIGGDMNHIHRVTLQLYEDDIRESKGTVVTVIVKTAPDEVLYLKKECGEQVKVDQQKVEFEYNTLMKFNEIQAHSVPHVYFLDRQHKTIIMEDLSRSGFIKLQDVLVSGDVAAHLPAIEGALAFIGRMHSATWLEEVESSKRRELIDNHSNSGMRQLMAELLFDRPFKSEERSNTCNPQLTSEVEQIRRDPEILTQFAKLKKAFLQQNDCLCHGDLATDNVMVTREQFRVIDLEFSGIGLRAYDLALFLEMTIFRILCCFHCGQVDRCQSLYLAVQKAAEGYELGVGREKARDPLFVEQTCGLIALELMWMVFGSYNIVEFDGDPSLEQTMLSMATNLLLRANTRQTIGWNIQHQFTVHNFQSIISNS